MTRIIVTVFCWLAFMPAVAVQAQEIDPESEIADIVADEAAQMKKNCARTYEREMLDCDCVEKNFFVNRMAQGPKASVSDLTRKTWKECVDKPKVAGLAHRRCLEWAPYYRDDFEKFCECYANTFTDIVSRSIGHPRIRPEARMSATLKRCGF